MTTKICTKCGVDKPLDDYYNNSRLRNGKFTACKKCIIYHQKEYKNQHPQEFKAKVKRSEQRPHCKARRQQYLKEYYSIEKNREKRRENLKRHRLKKGYVRPSVVQRIKRNLFRRLHHILRERYNSTMTKSLGCSGKELKLYLESHWLSGMTWENYGLWKKGEPMKWHIDHIVPCSAFDLTDPEQQKACFHYTNLQPLWAVDNMKKGAKW